MVGNFVGWHSRSLGNLLCEVVEIIREIWWFLAVLVLALVALILFPGIVLFLPRLLGYQG